MGEPPVHPTVDPVGRDPHGRFRHHVEEDDRGAGEFVERPDHAVGLDHPAPCDDLVRHLDGDALRASSLEWPAIRMRDDGEQHGDRTRERGGEGGDGVCGEACEEGATPVGAEPPRHGGGGGEPR